MKLTLFCDGACSPTNPGGYACWAWLALTQGVAIAQGYGCLGHGAGQTNNVSEYEAVLRAMRWAYRWMRDAEITIQTDSQLVVNQVNGKWDCNAEHLQPLCEKARKGLKLLGAQIIWIPREKNRRADALSELAYIKARDGRALPFEALDDHRMRAG